MKTVVVNTLLDVFLQVCVRGEWPIAAIYILRREKQLMGGPGVHRPPPTQAHPSGSGDEHSAPHLVQPSDADGE